MVEGDRLVSFWWNRLPDVAGEGHRQAPAFSILHHAGDGLFDYELDVVNMAEVMDLIATSGWRPGPGATFPTEPPTATSVRRGSRHLDRSTASGDRGARRHGVLTAIRLARTATSSASAPRPSRHRPGSAPAWRGRSSGSATTARVREDARARRRPGRARRTTSVDLDAAAVHVRLADGRRPSSRTTSCRRDRGDQRLLASPRGAVARRRRAAPWSRAPAAGRRRVGGGDRRRSVGRQRCRSPGDEPARSTYRPVLPGRARPAAPPPEGVGPGAGASARGWASVSSRVTAPTYLPGFDCDAITGEPVTFSTGQPAVDRGRRGVGDRADRPEHRLAAGRAARRGGLRARHADPAVRGAARGFRGRRRRGDRPAADLGTQPRGHAGGRQHPRLSRGTTARDVPPEPRPLGLRAWASSRTGSRSSSRPDARSGSRCGRWSGCSLPWYLYRGVYGGIRRSARR